jgi:hypothetical protein
MTRLGIANLVRKRTKTDTTTFPDADMLVYANLYLYEIAKLINDANEDYFGSISTTDLVADQREYTLPSDILLNSLKAVECKFSSSGDWIRLNELDINSVKRPTSETDIVAYYANETDRAFYDLYRNSLFIYSGTITSVTGGIKLYSFTEPDALPDMTNNSVDLSADPSSTGHGFPKAFHELLARRISIEFKSNAQQPIPLTSSEQNFFGDLGLALNSIKGRNKDRAVTARVPLINDSHQTTVNSAQIHDGYNY